MESNNGHTPSSSRYISKVTKTCVSSDSIRINKILNFTYPIFINCLKKIQTSSNNLKKSNEISKAWLIEKFLIKEINNNFIKNSIKKSISEKLPQEISYNMLLEVLEISTCFIDESKPIIEFIRNNYSISNEVIQYLLGESNYCPEIRNEYIILR
tara:strand:- start:3961 stop:4425 length:465 start_codon:yes stop_codon:yes gene_type:complete